MDKIMVSVSIVSRFLWSAEDGKRLRELREFKDKLTRAEFAEKVAANLVVIGEKSINRLKSESCSQHYIQKLEEARMGSIPAEMLFAITKTLQVTIDQLLETETWKSQSQ